jgi:hypothetical protein
MRRHLKSCELLIAEGLLCGRVVCSDAQAFREVSVEACHYCGVGSESRNSVMIAAVCNASAAQAKPAGRFGRHPPENVARDIVAR